MFFVLRASNCCFLGCNFMKREKGRNWLYCLPFLVCLSAFAKQQIRISMARFRIMYAVYKTCAYSETRNNSHNILQGTRSDKQIWWREDPKYDHGNTWTVTKLFWEMHWHVRQKRKYLLCCFCPLEVVIGSLSLDSHIHVLGRCIPHYQRTGP